VRKEFDYKRTSPFFPLQRRGIVLKILVAVKRLSELADEK